MVDVGDKASTKRTAVATGFISMLSATKDLIAQGNAKKGDVLGVARIAAIQGAKRTADLIPLCHPLALSHVSVGFDLQDDGIRCTATVETTGPTGVEMEAMTAVSISLLTIYDMCKGVDKGMVINNIALTKKSGGRSGVWQAKK